MLLSKPKTDAVPLYLSFPIADFIKYRAQWLDIWRTVGNYDEYGNWIVPVSFIDAQRIPRPMLDFFLEMDMLTAKLIEQRKKKK